MKCEVCGKELDGLKEDRPGEVGDYFSADYFPNPFGRIVYVCCECEEQDKAWYIWDAFENAERAYENG